MEKQEFVVALPSLKPLGGNRVLIDAYRALRDRGHSGKVLSVSGVGNTYFGLERDDISVIGSRRGGLFARALDLIKFYFHIIVLDSRTIVVVSDPILMIAVFFSGRKKIFRFHQSNDFSLFDFNEKFNAPILLRPYKFFTKVIYKSSRFSNYFVSSVVRESFLNNGGRHAREIVNPGVDLKLFSYREELRTKSTIAVFAKKARQKGLADLILALNSPRLTFRPARVLVISQDSLEITCDFKVESVSPRSDKEIAGLLNMTDILVFPSWEEGYGMPPLEAMACGCVPLIANCGGPDEYAIDSKNCLRFEAKKPEEIVQSLNRLAGDASFKETLRAEGLATVRHFSTESFSQNFCGVYEKFIGSASIG